MYYDEEFNEMAKSAAMDIGLTEDEAERELENFNSNCEDTRFCEDCGALLNYNNCKDPAFDDFCTNCWNKFLKKCFPNLPKNKRQEALNKEIKQNK